MRGSWPGRRRQRRTVKLRVTLTGARSAIYPARPAIPDIRLPDMSLDRHIVFALVYVALAVAVTLTLPYSVETVSRQTAVLAGTVVLVFGALLHEVAARLARDREVDEALGDISATQAELLAQLAQLCSEAAALHAALDTGDEAERARLHHVEEEVELLRSLVPRLPGGARLVPPRRGPPKAAAPAADAGADGPDDGTAAARAARGQGRDPSPADRHPAPAPGHGLPGSAAHPRRGRHGGRGRAPCGRGRARRAVDGHGQSAAVPLRPARPGRPAAQPRRGFPVHHLGGQPARCRIHGAVPPVHGAQHGARAQARLRAAGAGTDRPRRTTGWPSSAGSASTSRPAGQKPWTSIRPCCPAAASATSRSQRHRLRPWPGIRRAASALRSAWPCLTGTRSMGSRTRHS